MKLISRSSLLLAVLLGFASGPVCAQWSLEWNTTTGIDNNALSGWITFQQTGTTWQERFYTLDTLQFKVMDAAYSTTPQYTYTFSLPERLAGASLYSLGLDLTGDGITEFYVLSGYGTSTAYRQAVRIFDITTNTTVFELNTVGISYSYPTLMDTDNDNLYEAVFIRSNYPDTGVYYYDVYQTNTAVAAAGSPRPVPQRLGLTQNYPNPFNPSTRIDYELSAPGRVRLEITNLLGQHVRTLVDAAQTPGRHLATWDGAGEGGQNAASGAYFYRLEVDGKLVETKQMRLLK
jgi:hypothetical protein